MGYAVIIFLASLSSVDPPWKQWWVRLEENGNIQTQTESAVKEGRRERKEISAMEKKTKVCAVLYLVAAIVFDSKLLHFPSTVFDSSVGTYPSFEASQWRCSFLADMKLFNG
ncbi:hypothetical protein V8G54_009809, partial [Vigna mungo]